MTETNEIEVQKQIVAAIKGGVLEDSEGKTYLARYLDEAEDSYKEGAAAFTHAILTLSFIRDSGLWGFAYDKWEDCLESFIAERGVGKRSTLFDSLSVLRQWKALGKPEQDVADYAEGLDTIKPIFKGRNAIVAEYDRHTGEVVAFANGWEQKLPEGNTRQERLAAWVDENIKPEHTAGVVRHILKVDAPAQDSIEFGILADGDGKPTHLFWKMELVGGYYQDGAIAIAWGALPPRVMVRMCRLLGVPEWRA
jgi:hypothetical protein